MKRKIALIPVDARPVTYDLPKDLAKLAGWEVLLPPNEILGFLKAPADLGKLFNWVEEVSNEVEGIIVSIDMLLYGGLVPSRVNTDEEQVLRERLANFLDIKRKNPQLHVMAFSSTMRLSNSYVNQEEKDYWDQYGKEIWNYSFHSHRFAKHGEEKDQEISQTMKAKIPDWVLEDYLHTRQRNFSINLSMIEAVAQGLVELLIFPQDDTSEYGLNIQEQGKLQNETRKRNLHERIYIYPGADEVASMLTARMIYVLEDEHSPTFYPIYSGMKGSLSIAMYEDRAIQESVKGQIAAFGSHTVETPAEADVLIGVHVPGRKQGDLALQIGLDGVDTNDRNIGEWVKELRYYANTGKQVAIADVAYANGADSVMIPVLFESFRLVELVGFAAWNTAGNTIGTVVAQAALLHLAAKKGLHVDREKSRQFLIRYLDDYVYQSIVRQEIRRKIDKEEDITQEDLQEKVKELFLNQVNSMVKEIDRNFSIERIYLPWNRTFEIGIDLRSSN
ncbi:DUF4127 family protein [Ornithinibacillus salinisoli]|uniref:DUF4127 family protein n=1 Tax=Ornithinibacillus salinisoli TaxID=1848459 RepID=A0ABW4W157_9BACI